MRQRASDNAAAVALAIGLHVLIAALLWFAMRSRVESVEAAGGMQADVVGLGQLSAAMQRTLRDRPEPAETPPTPVPVDEPQPEPPQAQPQPTPPPVALPDTVDQQEVVDQPTPVKATETTPQVAKSKQQVDAAQPPTDREEALQAARLAQLAEVRSRRAAASREAAAAQERLEELQAGRTGSAAEESARADADASGAGSDNGLKGRYAAALQEAIRAKWTRPDNIPPGALCRLVIRQLPGGEVVAAEVTSPCAYDEQGRRSIEAAVLKAQPLPYAGFESVFSRTLILNFRAP